MKCIVFTGNGNNLYSLMDEDEKDDLSRINVDLPSANSFETLIMNHNSIEIYSNQNLCDYDVVIMHDILSKYDSEMFVRILANFFDGDTNRTYGCLHHAKTESLTSLERYLNNNFIEAVLVDKGQHEVFESYKRITHPYNFICRMIVGVTEKNEKRYSDNKEKLVNWFNGH